MPDPQPPTGDDDIDRALAALMEATDAFAASWAEAVRRFGAEPAAFTEFRAGYRPGRPQPGPGRPAFALATGTARHPLWDRELDR